ncbi:hypothetical protein K502DRAFT_127176 [Neoconidiobolus thromboides FSU 785]|nr:hypothetical protein K502DRAFT_127176 [Neoconidiobolus thromboides FSU 785]
MSLLNNYIRTQFENKKEIQGIFENKETLIQQSRDFDNLIWKEDLRYYFVYKWILKQDLYIADNIHLIIPPSLVLLQDMNLTIRTWGIDSINLLFKNKNLALLKSRGLQDVYLNVLVNNVLFINSDKKDNSNYAMDTMLSIFDKMYNNEDNEYYNKLYDYIITTILTRGNSVEANLIENNRFVLSYLNKVIDRMGITVYALLEKFINISLKNVKLPWIRKGNFITEIPTLACNNLIKLIKLCPNRIIDYAPEILTGIAQCILNFKDYKVDDDFFNLLINTTEITYNHSNTLQFKADLNALKQADDEVFGRFIDKVLANIEQ